MLAMTVVGALFAALGILLGIKVLRRGLMNARDTHLDPNEEVAEITAIEPIAHADASELVDVESGVVVAKVKRGLGLSALISAPPIAQDQTDSTEPEADHSEEAHEDVPLHKNGQLGSVIECMLFVSTEPLSSKQLAETLEIEECKVEDAVCRLEERLESCGGLQLMRVAGGYQLCTRPEYGDYCAAILQPAKKRLSKAALETLAVVAYRQPCTMAEIEAVRGVSVDGVMKTLMDRGIVKEAGRKQTPGRPILYATTPEFLEYFGLNELAELPDIDLMAVEKVKALEAQRELLLGETDSGELVPENQGVEASDKE